MDLTDLSRSALREYLARCFIHLTRDDRGSFPGGEPALNNFKSIMSDRCITANKAHCLHQHKLPPKQKDEFKVACFSKTSVEHVNWLIGRGAQTKLEGFGFLFHRQALERKGIHRVQYVNSYGPDMRLREAADRIFEMNRLGGFCGEIPVATCILFSDAKKVAISPGKMSGEYSVTSISS